MHTRSYFFPNTVKQMRWKGEDVAVKTLHRFPAPTHMKHIWEEINLMGTLHSSCVVWLFKNENQINGA